MVGQIRNGSQNCRLSHNKSTHIRGISTYTPGGHKRIPQGGIFLSEAVAYLRGIRITTPPPPDGYPHIYPPPPQTVTHTPDSYPHTFQLLDIRPP